MGLTNFKYCNVNQNGELVINYRRYEDELKNNPRKIQFYQLAAWLGYEAADSLGYPNEFLEAYAAYKLTHKNPKEGGG